MAGSLYLHTEMLHKTENYHCAQITIIMQQTSNFKKILAYPNSGLISDFCQYPSFYRRRRSVFSGPFGDFLVFHLLENCGNFWSRGVIALGVSNKLDNNNNNNNKLDYLI